jgi:hypothetical protein
MLGRKPIVEAQHPRAGRVGDAPGKIAKQRREAHEIGTAVQVQDVPARKRARRRDPLRLDATGVDGNQLGSSRRGRHKPREAGDLPTGIRDLNVRSRPRPHEPRQTETDQLGAQGHCSSRQIVCAAIWRGSLPRHCEDPLQ